MPPACSRILQIGRARHQVTSSYASWDLMFEACGQTESEEILENIPSPLFSGGEVEAQKKGDRCSLTAWDWVAGPWP